LIGGFKIMGKKYQINSVLVVLISCILIFSLLFVSGCKSNTSPILGPDEIVTNTDEVKLIVGESYTLMVADKEEFSEISFLSEDTSIVHIDSNGVISALKAGTTNIDVS